MFKKIKTETSGMIMIFVTLIVVVLAIVTVTLISTVTSQRLLESTSVDEITQQQLALGAFFRYYQQRNEGTLTALIDPPAVTEQVGGKTFTVDITPMTTPLNSGPNETQQIDILVTPN